MAKELCDDCALVDSKGDPCRHMLQKSNVQRCMNHTPNQKAHDALVKKLAPPAKTEPAPAKTDDKVDGGTK